MFLKRLVDIISAFCGLFLLAPLLFIIAILIKIMMPGDVLFTQYRIGKDGNSFKMYKFRSMKMFHAGSSISVKGESRITPLGAFLRKYKLDELPELWNVLIGNMSLVGPRPDVPGYADKLEGDDRIILTFKPGITGLASLKYANEEELLSKYENPQQYNDEILYPDKIKINKLYMRNWSLLLDLQIIYLTIFRNEKKINRILQNIGY